MGRLLYFIAFIVLVSCETEVLYDKTDYEAYVLANSIVSTDSTWKVDLHYSKSIFDNDDFRPVQDAQVCITVLQQEGDEQEEIQKFTLDDNGNGSYTRGSFPTEGKTYRLDVNIDGEVTTAETYVPELSDVEILELRVVSFGENDVEESLELDLSIGDDASKNNYYAWDIALIDSGNDYDFTEELTGGENPEEGRIDDPVDPKIGTPQPVVRPSLTRNPTISAVPFRNSTGKVTIGESVAEGSKLKQILTSKKERENNNIEYNGPTYKLRVWAISYDYYHYLISIQQSAPASTDVPFINPYSNIENGGGIFAGYNLKEILIEEQ